ncbi:MAG: sel1 repeat family protein [Synergistaceae bacterium]|nr:sel1 repeat family protein [Synergistaceae bacterium]
MIDFADIILRVVVGIAVLAVMPGIAKILQPCLSGVKGIVICVVAVLMSIIGVYWAFTVSMVKAGGTKTEIVNETVDYSFGEKVYRLSLRAESGDMDAQYELAEYCRDNYDIGDNKARALRLYEKAARAGHQKACFRLGGIYRGLYGSGLTEKNYSLALSWYGAGADSGGTDSQYELYSMYLRGEGVRRNPRMAYSYLYLMKLTMSRKFPAELEAELLRLRKLLPQSEAGEAVRIAERHYRFIRRNYPEALE